LPRVAKQWVLLGTSQNHNRVWLDHFSSRGDAGVINSDGKVEAWRSGPDGVEFALTGEML
jgi:hypothetical protein